MTTESTFTVFEGTQKVLTGTLPDLLTYLKDHPEPTDHPRLVFNDQTGATQDFDLRGTLQEVLARHLPVPEKLGRGRPKLGVMPREITLLPRHWEWLDAQPSGASATLRRLIDEARKEQPDLVALQKAQGATDRFMQVMAGDLAGYQEAARALYQRNQQRFLQETQDWPQDIRKHAQELARPVFAAPPQ